MKRGAVRVIDGNSLMEQDPGKYPRYHFGKSPRGHISLQRVKGKILDPDLWYEAERLDLEQAHGKGLSHGFVEVPEMLFHPVRR